MFSVDIPGLPPPHPIYGYAGLPAVQSWLQKATAGLPVTVEERSAMIAHLAWQSDVLARPPADVLRVRDSQGELVPFPYGALPGPRIALGGASYAAGDIVMPASRPAGAAPASAASPTTVAVSDAQRSAAYRNVQGLLHGLSLPPADIVVDTAPAGWWAVSYAPSGNLLAVVVVCCVVVAASSALVAYTAEAKIKAQEETARVRIVENGQTARVVAQVQGQTEALAHRLAYAQQTGVMPPPSPIELRPIESAPQQVVTEWGARAASGSTSSATPWLVGGSLVLVAGAAGYGYFALDRAMTRRATARVLSRGMLV